MLLIVDDWEKIKGTHEVPSSLSQWYLFSLAIWRATFVPP